MSLVIDASVLVELLLQSSRGRAAAQLMREEAGDLHVPHLADVESISVLRGLALGGDVGTGRATAALGDLRDFPATRWPAEPLFERIWELRGNLTAYDATYLALAEALDADLITADRGLASAAASGSTCTVTLVE